MELPKRYDPKEIEERWKNYWSQERVYAYDPSRGRDETFVVDTPPPTVSGSLHVGHMFSYSHQDFIVRFQRMCGKNIFFPIGWDDNGLPTERRVQNLMNVKCDSHLPYDPQLKVEKGRKGEAQKISRKNFVDLCDEVIADDEAAFRHLWTRLGLSYDWDEEYATIDRHCRMISQYSFLELLEKNEVYQDERPVLWDVDFQTAIAQAELVDKEIAGAYHHLKFGLQGTAEHFVVATTRPELLGACVAVLVHPEDDRYRHMVGQRAVTPLYSVPVPIMADEKADPEKGTGVVMVCTFGDQTDVEWWRQFGLPLRQIVGRDGRLLPVQFVAEGEETSEVHEHGTARIIPSLDPVQANAVYGEIAGKYVKQAQKRFVELATENGGVFDRPAKEIVHAVKFFEKGDRPLELIPTRQWYTRIMDKKDALVAQGQKIAWHPDYMLKRYEHWVEGLNQDWCLSRQRYFGVPIPVWYRVDEAGEILYDQRIVPTNDLLPVDPLSDTAPGFAEAQRDQPGGFTGEPDVLDTWATSSLTPQIASHWVQNPGRHKKLFPMDIRPQAHDIIRTWAFYTIVKAYLHEGEIPWRNVVLSGWILDPDRKKMSKSQGNVVTPEPLIDEHGSDSVRYWAARARLGVDTAYDEQAFKVGRKLCTKLFNASKFAIGRFSLVDQALLTPDKIVTETDRAVIAELRPLIERATAAFEQFDYAQTLSLVEDFFWRTLCDNYLELAKGRTYEEELTAGRLSACATLRLLHRAVVRMLAPFLPYLSEEVWSWAYSGDADMQATIHKSPWPTLSEFEAIPAPAQSNTFDVLLTVLDKVRKDKTDANVSMAAPVAKAVITVTGDAKTALESVLGDIVQMLHIEEATLVDAQPVDGRVSVETSIEKAPSA